MGAGGTATAGTDFGTVQSFDVTIAAGATSGTANFTFTPTDDSVVEGNATIGVTGSASGLMFTGAELTLTDNDTLQLNVSSARADEGESLVFTVTLSPAAAQAVTVDYATADGTATAGADYTAASGQLQFAAGDTSRTVSVPATDDSNPEADETFTLAVTLADASASAAGTIVDNDMAVVTVSAPEVVESASAAVFTVMLAAPNPREVTVEFETTPGGTATAGVDYVDTSSVAVLAPGQTELEFSVPVLDDTELESIETMLVRLEATDQWNARVLTTEGAIHDDDAADVRSTGASRTLYLLARSMTSEAVAAIGERFVGTDSTAPQVALGATPLAAGPGFGAAAGMGAAHPAAWSAGGAAWPGAGMGGTAWQQGAAFGAGAAGMGNVYGTGMGSAYGMAQPPSDEPFAELAWLDNAHFALPLGQTAEADDEAGWGSWTVWGRAGTVRSQLRAESGGGTARGDVFTSHVGLETRLNTSALVGVAVSHSVGSLGYTVLDPAFAGAAPGEGGGRVTSVQPYVHWAPRAGLTLWGMGGGGRGSLTVSDALGTVETPLGLRLFAGGGRQALTAGGGLALKADAFHATLRSDEQAEMAEATGTATRYRVLLEGRIDWSVSETSSLSPRVEAGVRRDGGTDVEGVGAELGGGLAYVNTRLNIGIETQGRYLLAHQADGFPRA